jgi:hypothetical protein
MVRGDFTALRSTYQERHGFAYEDYRIGIEEEIKTDPMVIYHDTQLTFNQW